LTSRPPRDEYFLMLAHIASKRSTCARRSVGCVLVDIDGYISATSYNGVPRNFPHCIDSPCPSANAESGKDLDLCVAIHAEQNALLQCKDTQQIYTAYCTVAPCITCVKLLLNTSCHRIFFLKDYPHPDSRKLWGKTSLRIWRHFPFDDFTYNFGVETN